MGMLTISTGKKQNSTWNGPERRSVQRVPRRNIRRAKLLITLATMAAITGGWLGFATAQPYTAPPPIASAPIGSAAPPILTAPVQFEK